MVFGETVASAAVVERDTNTEEKTENARALQARTAFPTTASPSTRTPTLPVTALPTSTASTLTVTDSPHTPSPTVVPTVAPTMTNSPSASPSTNHPSRSPSSQPTFRAPSAAPTASSPSSGPTTSAPSKAPSYTVDPRPNIVGYSGPAVFSSNVTTPTTVYQFTSVQAVVGTPINATCNAHLGWAPNTTIQFVLANLTGDSFVYSTSVTNGAIPVAANDTLPSGLYLADDTGNILGAARMTSDLTTYPITCVSFPRQVPAPTDFRAFVRRSSTNIQLFVQAWGRSGYIDEATGQMIGFENQNNNTAGKGFAPYPPNVTDLPFFCPLFWLGINSFGSQAYSTGVISLAFHQVRNSATPYMIYSDNPAFSNYELYLFLGAIPFWALTVACLILYPSFVFVRACCRATKCGTTIAECCTRYAIDRDVDAGTDEAPLVDADTPISSVPTGRKTNMTRPRSGKRRAFRSSRRLTSQRSRRNLVGNANEEKSLEDEEEEEVDDDMDDPANQVVRKYQRTIARILTSPHVSKRYCFLFVAVFAVPCLAALVIGQQMALSESNSLFDEAGVFLIEASNSSTVALQLVNNTIAYVGNTTKYGSDYQQAMLAQLSLGRDRISRLLSLSDPANLRVDSSLLSNLMISDQTQMIIEIITFLVQVIGPVLIAVSLLLASCTCRWGDTVLFGNAAVCVGLSLKGWLILCATLAWFCVMFYFWNTSVLADICYLPSILYVPPTNSSQLMVSPADYNGSDNNYAFPYGYSSNILASFYWQCRFNMPTKVSSVTNVTDTSFGYTNYNPMSFFVIQSNEFNTVAADLARSVGDNVSVASLVQVQQLMQQTLDVVGCEQLGQQIQEGINDVCGKKVTGNFLTFFFLCTLAILWMIVIPCTEWIAPNLYRQWQANRVYERASKDTERLIKIASRMTTGTPRSAIAKGGATHATGSAFGGSFQMLRHLAGVGSGRKDQAAPQPVQPQPQAPPSQLSPINGSAGSFASALAPQLGEPHNSSTISGASDGNAGRSAAGPHSKPSADDLAIA